MVLTYSTCGEPVCLGAPRTEFETFIDMNSSYQALRALGFIVRMICLGRCRRPTVTEFNGFRI